MGLTHYNYLRLTSNIAQFTLLCIHFCMPSSQYEGTMTHEVEGLRHFVQTYVSSIVALFVMRMVVRVRWPSVTSEMNIHERRQNDALSVFTVRVCHMGGMEEACWFLCVL